MVAYLTSKELARRTLLDWITFRDPTYVVAPHHAYLCREITAWLDGAYGDVFLAVSMPPRHGKSRIVSVELPAWYLCNHPEQNIIHISYAASLSNEFSRMSRAIVRDDPTFRTVFPDVALDDEKSAVSNWRTVRGGGLFSVGSGGGISGHGANLMIIDDIHKEGDQLSPAALEATTTWYSTGARTRLAPGARILLNGTRWSPVDLHGFTEAAERNNDHADKWRRIVLPGLAKPGDVLGRLPGEALWPEWFPRKVLDAMRALDEQSFDALVQQEPRATLTVVFDRHDFVIVEPENVPKIPAAWFFDLALGQSDRSDYNVWARVTHENEVMCFHRIERTRERWPDTRRRIKELILQNPDDVFVFPPHTFELMAVQELADELPEDAWRIHQQPASGDKLERAQPYAVRVAAHKVWIERCQLTELWLDEHAIFDAGAHDDMVDVGSLATHYYGYDAGIYDTLREVGQQATDHWHELIEEVRGKL